MKIRAAMLIPAAIALGSVSSLAFADDSETVKMEQLPAATRETIQSRAQGGKVEEIAKLSDDNRLFKAEIKKGDIKDYLYVDSSGKVVGEHVKK